MMEWKDYKKLAAREVDKPTKDWPLHESRHRRTLLGARLFDEQCLRCHIEELWVEQNKELSK